MTLQPPQLIPFKGLVPFTEEDAKFFFGREEICDLIIAHLQTWHLTLVYGASGVGKSSVLHAGVMPTLRQMAAASLADSQRTTPEFSVITFNSWRDDPAAALARRIQTHLTEIVSLPEQPSPARPTLAEALDQWVSATDTELYIVLDQFEEYFQYHGRSQGPGTFATEFPRAFSRQNSKIRFLISIREEAVAKLDLFRGGLPNLFDHILRIHPLGIEEARKAIEGPIAEYNTLPAAKPVAIQPELLEVVLQSFKRSELATVAPGADPKARSIDATILQQVMIKLWEEDVRDSGSNVLRLSTLERLGGAERIVRTHFSSVMERLSDNDQKIAAVIFRYLVTPSGTKIAQTAADLAAYSDLSKESVANVLDRLSASDVRILRAIAPPADQPGDVRFEIFHDVLSSPINDWWRRYEEEQRLERTRIESIRNRELDRARYSRRIAVGLSVMIVLLLALTFYAFGQKALASQRAASESKAKLGEEVAKKEALEWARRENQARGIAEEQAKLASKRADEAEDAKQKTVAANKLALHNLDLANAATKRADARAADAVKAHNVAQNFRNTDASYRAAFRLSRRKEEREEAIAEFQKAFKVYAASTDPKDHLAAVDTLLNIGEVYADMGNDTDATKAFERALAASPPNLKASLLTNIGNIYRALDPPRELYDPSLLSSWSPYALGFEPKERALTYYEAAIGEYDNLIEGNPINPDKNLLAEQAGVFVSLGLTKLDLVEKKKPDLRPQAAADAIQDIEKGRTMYEYAGNHPGQAYALFALAEAKSRGGYASWEMRPEILKLLERARAENQATSNLKGEIPVLRKMVRMAVDPKQALAWMERVVSIYRTLNDKPGTAGSLVELATLVNSQSTDWKDHEAKNKRTIELYLEAAKLYQESGRLDKAAETLMTVSGQYPYDSRLAAGSVLEEAAGLYRQLGSWERHLNVLGSLVSLWANEDKAKAITHLDEMKKIAGARKKPEEQALAFQSLAVGYIRVADFPTAEFYAGSAIAGFKKAKDISGEWSALHSIAQAYSFQNQVDKSIEYYQKALDVGDQDRDGTTLVRLGEAFAKKKDTPKAIEFYERALKVFQDQKNPYLESTALTEIGKLYGEQSRFDEGVAYLNRAITVLQPTFFTFQQKEAFTSLVKLYEAKGDITAAIETLERSLQFFAEKKVQYGESETLQKISELYLKKGETKLAEQYKQRSLSVATAGSSPSPTPAP